MKIQEMKSGMLHLAKRTDPARIPVSLIAERRPSPAYKLSELDDSIWAVVSFDKIEQSDVTYAQASVLMARLDAGGVSGLAIIAQRAAARLRD